MSEETQQRPQTTYRHSWFADGDAPFGDRVQLHAAKQADPQLAVTAQIAAQVRVVKLLIGLVLVIALVGVILGAVLVSTEKAAASTDSSSTSSTYP